MINHRKLERNFWNLNLTLTKSTWVRNASFEKRIFQPTLQMERIIDYFYANHHKLLQVHCAHILISKRRLEIIKILLILEQFLCLYSKSFSRISQKPSTYIVTYFSYKAWKLSQQASNFSHFCWVSFSPVKFLRIELGKLSYNVLAWIRRLGSAKYLCTFHHESFAASVSRLNIYLIGA